MIRWRLFQMLLLICFMTSCSHKQVQTNGQDFYPANFNEPAYVKPVPVPPKALKPLIIVDPGHGGEDQGTLSILKPVYQEKFLTLITSKLLKEYLEKMGYQVKMTRSEDVFIPLSMRAKIANDTSAAVFVSVHYNSAPSPEAHGIEIFYYRSDTDFTRTNASQDLAKQVLLEIIPLSQAKSRGVKNGNFAVIRETKMPAILVEGGFLTNKDELEKIKDPQYLKTIAWGIAKGIDNFLK
jgi:N-acetylmuramoyl-L-alanine amidase